MSNYRTALTLFIILIIAGFLRFYQITTTPPGLYPDEAIGANQGLEAARTGSFKLFYPENNGREGLYINLQGISEGIFGATKPWAARLPSAIFGILTVLGMYFLGKELFSERIGLLSAFFLATNFWHINFSRIGFSAVMAPFFLVWAVYFLLKALHPKNSTYYLLPTTYSIIAGIFYGLGFHSYIPFRVTPVLVLSILIYYWRKSKKENRRRQFLLSTLCFLFSALVVALPIGMYFLAHPADFSQRTSEISVFSSKTPLQDIGSNIIKTLGMFNFRGDGNWRHNYPGRPELFWPVGVLFLIGIVIAIKNIIQKSNIKNQNENAKLKNENNLIKTNIESLHFAFWILISWFILGALPEVISNEGLPHALRSILMIPPAMLFAGIGGVWLYNFLIPYIRALRVSERWLPFASAIFLLFLVFEAYNAYFILWAKNPNVSGAFSADYVELGEKLNKLPVNVPKYVVVKAGGVLVNGIPVPAQTVMFITDTYSIENQRAKNVYYVLPDQENSIPANAEKFYIE